MTIHPILVKIFRSGPKCLNYNFRSTVKTVSSICLSNPRYAIHIYIPIYLPNCVTSRCCSDLFSHQFRIVKVSSYLTHGLLGLIEIRISYNMPVWCTLQERKMKSSWCDLHLVIHQYLGVKLHYEFNGASSFWMIIWGCLEKGERKNEIWTKRERKGERKDGLGETKIL